MLGTVIDERSMLLTKEVSYGTILSLKTNTNIVHLYKEEEVFLMQETSTNTKRVILVAGSSPGLPELFAERIQIFDESALVQTVHPYELRDRCVDPYRPDLVVLTNYNIPRMDVRSMIWGMDALGINVLVLVSPHTYCKVAEIGTVTVMPKIVTRNDLKIYLSIALATRLYSYVLLPDPRIDRMIG